MKDYLEFLIIFDRVIHKYNQWENKKRTYDTDDLMSRPEIHTIAAVGDNPGINITTLAAVLGITKGAASQMIYKLVDKGTIEKKISPNSDTEVALNLTEKGMMNYEAHKKYHQQTNDESLALLKDMPDYVYKSLLKYLSLYEQQIDKMINEE